MSVLILPKKHIDVLVYGAFYRFGDALESQDETIIIRESTKEFRTKSYTANMLGTELFNENYRAYNENYALTQPSLTPDQYLYATPRHYEDVSPLQLLRACGAYEYQVCGTDDYYMTFAYHIINLIKDTAISELAGYYDTDYIIADDAEQNQEGDIAHNALTEKELNDAKIFVARMIPHLLDGMDFEEAGRAVLERDRTIINTLNNKEIKSLMGKMLADRVYQNIKRDLTE